MSNDKIEIARLRALIQDIQASPPGGGDVTEAEVSGAIANFPTRVEVTGAIADLGGGGIGAAQISGAITGAIINFPTRIEVTGALASYATLTGLTASFATKAQVTGAISNFPTRTEVTGVISDRPTRTEVTGVLTNYAGLNAANIFIISQVISGNLNVTGNISASTITASYFSGDGSGLSNLPSGVPANEISGAITASLVPYWSGSQTAVQVTGAISSFPTRTEVTGALNNYATLSGVSASFTTPAQVTGAISNFPTRTETSGAITSSLTNYARVDQQNIFTASQVISGNLNVTGTISGAFVIGDGSGLTNLPGGPGGISGTEVSGAITSSLASYARLDQQNYFSASQTISGTLYLSSSRATIETARLMDFVASGSNVSGTQILLNITNSAGTSQLIAQVGTVALIQAGATGSWPYYLQVDAQNKFVALEADNESGSIYIGGTGQMSSIHIASAGSRMTYIGNTSGSTLTTILGDVTFASGTITGISGAGGVTAAQVTGAISDFPTRTEVTGAISSFPTRTEVTGAMSSFPTRTEVTGAISTHPSRTEVTGALNSYATLTGLTASFATKAQVTGAISNFPTRVEVSGAITGSVTLQTAYDGGATIQLSHSRNFNILAASFPGTSSVNITASGVNFFTDQNTRPITFNPVANPSQITNGVVIVAGGSVIGSDIGPALAFGSFYGAASSSKNNWGCIFGSQYTGGPLVQGLNFHAGYNHASGNFNFMGGDVFTSPGTGSDSGNKYISILPTSAGGGYVISYAASGSTAFAISNNGAKLLLGAGTKDYFFSDGTRIKTPGGLYVGELLSGSTLSVATSASIGTNTFTNSSILLEMSSSTKGVLFPRITGTSRAAMTTAAGLIVYQTDTSGSDGEGLYIYKSTGWIQII